MMLRTEFLAVAAAVMLAFMMRLARWLDRREEKKRRESLALSRRMVRAAAGEDHNPGGPLTEGQATRMFEDALQAAIRQKADEILIDSLAGRPQVRLRVEGAYQELMGLSDGVSFARLAAVARAAAGLGPLPVPATVERGSFSRLYRKPHLRTWEWRHDEDGGNVFSYYERSRRGRAMRFGLESYPAPGGGALRITLRPEVAPEGTRFDLGFCREAEQKFIRAARSRSGIVLLTGPCNSGKSTATYHLLSLLRDEGRKIITVEWPAEWRLRGVEQHDLGDGPGAYDRVGSCLREAVGDRPDVLLLQNIDWVYDRDAQAAIDFAAAGGLLVTAVHSPGCVAGLRNLFRRHFLGQRKDLAQLLRVVVSPRRLFMVCSHCAEEYPVPAKVLVESGMSDPPTGANGKVATWRGCGCQLCAYSGGLGSTAVYEVLDLQGEMRRFLDNANEWDWGQLEYLERQAWQRGMRTQRELALERVVAGDIDLKQALLNTVKPGWLVKAQAARKKENG